MTLSKQFEKETKTENPMSNGFLRIVYYQKYVKWLEKKLLKQ